MNAREPARRLLLVILGIVVVASIGVAQQPMMSATEVGLRMAMRAALDNNARWTRLYIVSSLAGLSDVNRVKGRLLESADDVADALRPYYRYPVAVSLAKQFRRHVLLTVALVTAARDGDSLQSATAHDNWSAGSDSLVQFLAHTNPNWPAGKLGDMLGAYQDRTWRQIAARMRQDWFADVVACDQSSIEARAIADALSAGIVKQFPGKFK
jgi:hypothetical protein